MRKTKRFLTAFIETRESITISIFGAYLLILLLFNPIFFRVRNLQGLAIAAAVEVPAVMGMHALLATGNFDLSVGSVAAFVGIAVALILTSTESILLAVGVGLAIGIVIDLPPTVPKAKDRARPIVAKVTIKAFNRTFATKRPFIRPKRMPIARPTPTASRILSVPVRIIATTIPTSAATDPTERSKFPVASNACIPITAGTSTAAAIARPCRFLTLKKMGLKKSSIKRYAPNIQMVMDSLVSIKVVKNLFDFVIFSTPWAFIPPFKTSSVVYRR